ncbi:hypothetical protein M422DRAFT_157874 [Sphaerobolus stellatus SS14]|nr:hypothetical protein M422DRAFT_157874 [Sphaerobolus stellatus SS14]
MVLHRKAARSALQELFFWSRAAGRVSRQPRRYNHASTQNVQKIIEGSIKASGPIPVSTYMQLCLSHPTEGYYMKAHSDGTDVFGVQGDFITSPEISQVFGELICLWFLSIWRYPSQGTPLPKIRLIELGPGRGTLTEDFVRTLNVFPDSRAALTSIHLVETSPFLRSRQAEKLEAITNKITWYDSIEDIPLGTDNEFTMIVAHELFDALPINIIQKTQDGFRELMVDLSTSTVAADASSGSDTKQPSKIPFQFVLSKEPTARSEFLGRLSPRYSKIPEGTRIEVSSVAWKIARRIGEMLSRSSSEGVKSSNVNGAALIIDYGDEHAFPSSFRAFKSHRLVDVFQDPGKCDLTANVDFALLKEAVQDIATTYGPLDQRDFLMRMGIMQRMAALANHAKDEKRRQDIQLAGLRLIDKSGQGMGKVYRVLGITNRTEGKVDVWPFVDLSKTEV